MKNFNPYEIDINSIKPSRKVTDEAEILKFKLSAEINRVFDKMNTEEIIKKTSLNPSDISRLKIQNIKRFSIDRLIKILCLLGKSVNFTLTPKKTTT